jgi:hypothetical protein
MEKLERAKADAATIKAFKASHQKPEIDEAREAAEAEANYRMNLECAEVALREWLTAEDREDIGIAVTHLKIGWALHEQSSDPVQLRRAANYLMFAAHVIGSRCTVCDSEKEYWRRQSCRAGGEKEDEPQRLRKIWETYVKGCLAESPELSAALMVDSLLVDKEAPKCLPKSRDYLLKQVGKLKKEMEAASEKDDRLRLIQGDRA